MNLAAAILYVIGGALSLAAAVVGLAQACIKGDGRRRKRR